MNAHLRHWSCQITIRSFCFSSWFFISFHFLHLFSTIIHRLSSLLFSLLTHLSELNLLQIKFISSHFATSPRLLPIGHTIPSVVRTSVASFRLFLLSLSLHHEGAGRSFPSRTGDRLVRQRLGTDEVRGRVQWNRDETRRETTKYLFERE